jgi:hypothetical protein
MRPKIAMLIRARLCAWVPADRDGMGTLIVGVSVLKQGSAFLLDSGGKRRLVVAIAFQSILSYSISVDSVEVGSVEVCSSGNEQPRSWSARRHAVRSSRETSLILCDICRRLKPPQSHPYLFVAYS